MSRWDSPGLLSRVTTHDGADLRGSTTRKAGVRWATGKEPHRALVPVNVLEGRTTKHETRVPRGRMEPQGLTRRPVHTCHTVPMAPRGPSRWVSPSATRTTTPSLSMFEWGSGLGSLGQRDREAQVLRDVTEDRSPRRRHHPSDGSSLLPLTSPTPAPVSSSLWSSPALRPGRSKSRAEPTRVSLRRNTRCRRFVKVLARRGCTGPGWKGLPRPVRSSQREIGYSGPPRHCLRPSHRSRVPVRADQCRPTPTPPRRRPCGHRRRPATVSSTGVGGTSRPARPRRGGRRHRRPLRLCRVRGVDRDPYSDPWRPPGW